MTAKLVLVRHGQTTSNVAKILDTRLPGAGLTETGVAQAKAFGAALAVRPKALYCSAALRAEQTAAYIGAAVGISPVTLSGLHEVQLGELDSTSGEQERKQFADIFHAWHAGDLTPRAPGGESGRDVLDRYLPVLEQLRAEHLTGAGNGADGDVLVVSHGAAIRLAARYLADIPWLFAANNHLDNTATVELVPTPQAWECARWGKFEPPFVEVSVTADIPMG